MMRRQDQQDQQSRVFYELSALVLNLLRSPPTPIQFSDHSPVVPSSPSSSRRPPPAATQISPAGFASLMLGISMALMLCGSVTFFIGFILMPWVLGLVMVFYVAGIVSSLSVLGKSIFLLRVGSVITAKGDACMEVIVKKRRVVQESGNVHWRRMEQHKCPGVGCAAYSDV